jgi:hypothetical protein
LADQYRLYLLAKEDPSSADWYRLYQPAKKEFFLSGQYSLYPPAKEDSSLTGSDPLSMGRWFAIAPETPWASLGHCMDNHLGLGGCPLNPKGCRKVLLFHFGSLINKCKEINFKIMMLKNNH